MKKLFYYGLLLTFVVGIAFVLTSDAYAVTDSRYFLQNLTISSTDFTCTGDQNTFADGTYSINKAGGQGTDNCKFNTNISSLYNTSNLNSATNGSIIIDLTIEALVSTHAYNTAYSISDAVDDGTNAKATFSNSASTSSVYLYQTSTAGSLCGTFANIPIGRSNFTLEFNVSNAVNSSGLPDFTMATVTCKINNTIIGTMQNNFGFSAAVGNDVKRRSAIQMLFWGNPSTDTRGMNFILHGIYGLNNSYSNTEPPPTININETKPYFNMSYPQNYTTINNGTLYPIKINGTIFLQNGTVQNLTINSTSWRYNQNITNFTFYYNGSGSPNGLWVLNLTVNSTAGNKTSTIVEFTIDMTSPLLGTSTLDLNRTLFYVGTNTNFTYQINISDETKLFSINVSNNLGYSAIKMNINTTSYIYNGSLNVSTYQLGKNNLTAIVCDAHTDELIPDYVNEVNKDSKEILFDFNPDERNFLEKFYLDAPTPKKVSILPLDPTILINSEAIKQEDRYIFKYQKKDLKQKSYSFIVESDDYIEIIGNDKGYYGWLVIPSMKKWIDFNTENGDNIKYVITRLSDKSVQVDVDGITDEFFEFHSIGDLNCQSKDYSYYLFNYTAIYAATATETTQEALKLVIDFRDIRLNGNGTINYNNINYNTTNLTSFNQLNLSINFSIPEVSGNQTNVTFFWNFVLNTTPFTTINFTQLVNKVRIGVCSDGDTRTLNISIFNELSTAQYLEGDIRALFTIWTNSSENNINFTFNLQGETNYSLCVFPNTTINTNADLSYNTTGGFTQRWYLRNAHLTTNTSLLYLYNFNSQTGISTLKGSLKDNGYNEYANVITKLQKRYLTENIYRTVQMDLSDDFGLVLFNIQENSQDYILSFEQNSVNLDSTNPLKFYCTSGLCDVTFVVNVDDAISSADVQFKTSYNNITEMYQVNFTDTTGLTSSVRMVVATTEGVNPTTICDQTVTASDGTINCNTTGYRGTLKVTLFSSASPEYAKIIEYIEKLKNRLFENANSIISQKELIFWGTGFSVTLIMAGSLISPVAGIAMYIASLFAIVSFGLINAISITFISFSVVLGVFISYLINKRIGQ